VIQGCASVSALLEAASIAPQNQESRRELLDCARGQVRATVEELEVESVCIPRPIERNEREDGGPLAYRVTHRVKLWKPGSAPRMERTAQEGTLPLVL